VARLASIITKRLDRASPRPSLNTAMEDESIREESLESEDDVCLSVSLFLETKKGVCPFC